MTTTPKRQADAVAAVLALDGECWLDQATAFTCSEAEAIAELFRAYGREGFADHFIEVHAEGDEEGDDHYTGDDDEEAN